MKTKKNSNTFLSLRENVWALLFPLYLLLIAPPSLQTYLGEKHFLAAVLAYLPFYAFALYLLFLGGFVFLFLQKYAQKRSSMGNTKVDSGAHHATQRPAPSLFSKKGFALLHTLVGFHFLARSDFVSFRSFGKQEEAYASGTSVFAVTYNIEKYRSTAEDLHRALLPYAPDVLCLNESGNYDFRREEGRKPSGLVGTLNEYTWIGTGENHLGVKKSFGSLVSSEEIPLVQDTNDRPIVFARVLQKDSGRQFELYCMHLEPTYLYQHVKEAVFEFPSNHWMKTYETREKELQEVVKLTKSSAYPVLLLGDFNAAPNSQFLEKNLAHLEDAWNSAEVGQWGGYTAPESFPLLRIDRIFTSSEWVVRDVNVFPWSLSDHKALGAHVALR